MKQGLLIDMDGVIYSGEELIFGADKFINNLIKKISLSHL
ncbi:NagD protein [Pedobacter antarcticus]|uniref:NagD protein n=1 Tax=Pedobacter antarcticus TaxID=34086 RepID=A0A1I2AJ06_9SPHI|nr:NagD protein [Pedobacter antarcticus]